MPSDVRGCRSSSNGSGKLGWAAMTTMMMLDLKARPAHALVGYTPTWEPFRIRNGAAATHSRPASFGSWHRLRWGRSISLPTPMPPATVGTLLPPLLSDDLLHLRRSKDAAVQ